MSFSILYIIQFYIQSSLPDVYTAFCKCLCVTFLSRKECIFLIGAKTYTNCVQKRPLSLMYHGVSAIVVHPLSKLSGRSSAPSYQILFPPSTSSGLEILIVRNRPVQSYTSSNKNSYTIKKIAHQICPLVIHLK